MHSTGVMRADAGKGLSGQKVDQPGFVVLICHAAN